MRTLFLLSVVASALLACGGSDAAGEVTDLASESVAEQTAPAPSTPGACTLDEPTLTGPALAAFDDDSELERYVATASATCSAPTRGFTDAGTALPEASPSAGTGGLAPTQPPSDSITNTQETGVDEGDIVKNVDRTLIILRKGRLYAVDVSSKGSPQQTDSVRVAASEALNEGVWYDELLVHGDLIYVVGYRYRVQLATESQSDVSFAGPVGATEIDVFQLRGGSLVRLGQTFIESWDYFSGDNYASRLVDGQLVFYMPFSAVRGRKLVKERSRYEGHVTIPRVLRYDLRSERFEVVGPLFSAKDVFRPLGRPRSLLFHSIVKCDLEGRDLRCASKAFLGDYGREFYVSPKRVYLWSADHVYAMGLESFGVSAHRVSGAPMSQFAFKELDETLYVATWEYDRTRQLTLWKLPLAAFDQTGAQSLDAGRRVPSAQYDGYPDSERYVGSTYVAALSRDSSRTPSTRIFLDVRGGGDAQVEGSRASRYERIEPIGSERALLVGRTGRGLTLEVWKLGAQPAALADDLVLPGRGQAESRSHGFFYEPLEGDHGVFGLPTLGAGDAVRQGSGFASISFFDVDTRHQLSQLGAISSTGSASVCETSCIDWYGNTRPIFLGDRVFALAGSELVEVALRPQAATVGRRLVLAPRVESR